MKHYGRGQNAAKPIKNVPRAIWRSIKGFLRKSSSKVGNPIGPKANHFVVNDHGAEGPPEGRRGRR